VCLWDWERAGSQFMTAVIKEQGVTQPDSDIFNHFFFYVDPSSQTGGNTAGHDGLHIPAVSSSSAQLGGYFRSSNLIHRTGRKHAQLKQLLQIGPLGMCGAVLR
jgi:hypothetical protein